MARTASGSVHAPHRLVWVDVARGLALLSMVVAHTAPEAGPLGVLDLSEHLTAALLAALVGVSAYLEGRRHGLGRALVRALVRAVALLAAAWLDSLFGAQVADILGHLAVLTVVMSLLGLLPGLVQLVLAVAAGAAGLWIAGQGTPWVAGRLADLIAPAERTLGVDVAPASLVRLASGLLTDGPYRLTLLLACALLGAVVVHSVQGGGIRAALRLGGPRGPGLGGRAVGGVWAGVGLVLAGAALAWSHQRTGLAPEPYRATVPALLLATGLVLLALGACAAVVPTHLPWLTGLLAVPGSMTLSVYVAHQAYLGWAVGGWTALDGALRPGPGFWRSPAGTDDTWGNVLVLCLGAVLLPVLWRAVVRAEPCRRGPLEGPVALVTRSLAR